MSNIKQLAILPPAPPAASRRYELNLGDCIGDYVINYDFNPGGDPNLAIPCRITLIEFGSSPQTTGFCGSLEYNQALSELGFSSVSQALGNGFITYSKTRADIKSISLIIDSPIPGSKWSFTLNCPSVCDSDSDSDNLDILNCGDETIIYGPNTIACGEEIIGGGNKNPFNCSEIITVFGPDGDSDYCLNCLSNVMEVSINCTSGGGGGGGGDSDSGSDSDIATTGNILFDKSSWSDIPEPYKTYLNAAADRWSNFLRIYPAAVPGILSVLSNTGEQNWNGIKLASQNSIDNLGNANLQYPYVLYNDSVSGVIASCGPVYVASFSHGGNIQGAVAGSNQDNKVSINFFLRINTYWLNTLSPQNWIDNLTHELGHALGIGIYWNLTDSDSDNLFGQPLPQDNFLDGTFFKNAQLAYNSIVGNSSLSKVPLESTGDANKHWEDNFRVGGDGNNYPGLVDEIMVADLLPTGLNISKLSIKTLVDFGYEEINPGTQEVGDPDISVTQPSGGIELQKTSIKHCSCSIDIEPKIIDLRKT